MLQSLSNYSNSALLLKQQQQNGTSLAHTHQQPASNGYGNLLQRSANATALQQLKQQQQQNLSQLNANLESRSAYGMVAINGIGAQSGSSGPTGQLLSNGVRAPCVPTGDATAVGPNSQSPMYHLQLNPQHSKMWISQPTLGASNPSQPGNQIRSMVNLNQMGGTVMQVRLVLKISFTSIIYFFITVSIISTGYGSIVSLRQSVYLYVSSE